MFKKVIGLLTQHRLNLFNIRSIGAGFRGLFGRGNSALFAGPFP